jgi:tRNA-specific 2-thiouridylase
MSMNRKKVIVGFSGGKDSTSAALILKRENYDVSLLIMKIGLPAEEERIDRAKNLARVLGVPLKTVGLEEIFKEKVIDYFLRSYARSLTPNPCIVCNNEIKFKILSDYALNVEGADFFATGHYAEKVCIDGNFYLKEPVETRKSQVYFLSMLGREKIRKVLFPLAPYTLEEVRKLVVDLPLVNRHESQDACFLHDLSLTEYLKMHLPEKFKRGDILDIDGNKIGTHPGAVYFTIGQRRGIDFPSDGRLYVIRKDVRANTITLAESKYLYTRELRVMEPVFWRDLEMGEVVKVRIRSQCDLVEAQITGASRHFISAQFLKPTRAVTPGQIAAFYEEDIIVAAGFIA